MSPTDDHTVKKQECAGSMSESNESDAACSSANALLKSSAASEYACSVWVEVEIFPILRPGTRKKRGGEMVVSHDARRNIFNQAKRARAQF